MLMQLDGAEQAFRTLRILSLHGDRTLAGDVELYRSKLPASCFIHVSLGSMEAATIVFGFVPPAVAPDATSVSPGYLASGKSILVLDEDGRPAKIGEEGELVVRSRNIALGAWQDGQMVQGPFLPDPDDPERRIFHTRDIVRIQADGSLRYIGRRDRRIKIRGLRADPADVEAALRRYPGIADVAVISRPLGEDAVFVAYATATPDRPAPTAAALRSRLYEDIPDHMVPVEIIFLGAIPRLPNFKPDLQYLARYDRERSAETAGRAAGSGSRSLKRFDVAVENFRGGREGLVHRAGTARLCRRTEVGHIRRQLVECAPAYPERRGVARPSDPVGSLGARFDTPELSRTRSSRAGSGR